MAEYYGWAGKILRVDLTTGEITTQDDAKYHKYIGGAELLGSQAGIHNGQTVPAYPAPAA